MSEESQEFDEQLRNELEEKDGKWNRRRKVIRLFVLSVEQYMMLQNNYWFGKKSLKNH